MHSKKKFFPIFSKKSENYIYFDTAASAHKPKKVIDAVVEFYENYNSNVHRGVHEGAERATELTKNQEKEWLSL